MSDAKPRRRVVVLISGRGSNLLALIEHSRAPDCAFTVCQVISDRPEAAGLAAARDSGIPAVALGAQRADRAAFESELARTIEQASPALIALAGFMRILSADFVRKFEGRVMNIHPSLLPQYPGLHTHRRVLAAHEARHGATVHFVTERLDGGPRIIQGLIEVRADDDEASLAARVLRQEHLIYPLAVHWYCEGRLWFREGRAWLDGRALVEPVQFAPAASYT